MELFKLSMRVLRFFMNCVMLKHLLILLFTEFSRMKRMVTKTVNRSRSLRVSDTKENQSDQQLPPVRDLHPNIPAIP